MLSLVKVNFGSGKLDFWVILFQVMVYGLIDLENIKITKNETRLLTQLCQVSLLELSSLS